MAGDGVGRSSVGRPRERIHRGHQGRLAAGAAVFTRRQVRGGHRRERDSCGGQAVPQSAPVRRTRDQVDDYDNFHSGTWADDGWIYWTNTYPGGIVRVRDSGGPIETVTELDVKTGERSHRFAHLLPGGQALIYTVAFAGHREL